MASLETDSDFHFGAINCLVQGDLCSEHGVRGWPTIQLWQDGDKVDTYSGEKEYDALKEYVNGKATLKSASDIEELEGEEDEVEQELEEIQEEEDIKEGQDIQEEQTQLEKLPNPEGVSVNLDGNKMKEIAAGSVPWFVKFYAPWCHHCKALAPTWTELATHFRGQLNIGEVNCDLSRGKT